MPVEAIEGEGDADSRESLRGSSDEALSVLSLLLLPVLVSGIEVVEVEGECWLRLLLNNPTPFFITAAFNWSVMSDLIAARLIRGELLVEFFELSLLEIKAAASPGETVWLICCDHERNFDLVIAFVVLVPLLPAWDRCVRSSELLEETLSCWRPSPECFGEARTFSSG